MLSTDIHSVLHNRFEILIEITHHVGPFLITLGNLVKLLFHLSSEVIVHDTGEILQEEVVHHNTDVGRHEFSLVTASNLGTGFLGDLLSLEHNRLKLSFLALLITLVHIFALLDGANRRSIGRRTSDTQFFKFVDKTSLGVSHRALGVTLQCRHLASLQRLSLINRRKHACALGIHLLVVISRFMIYLNKSVEFHDLTICNKLLIETSARDVDSSLLDLGISHLTGNGALPNKFVETFFLCTSLDGRGSHIGRTDSLVSLLGTL